MRHINVILRHLAKGRAVMIHPRIKHLAQKAVKHYAPMIEEQLEKMVIGEGMKQHKVHHKKRALHFKL